MAVFVDSQTTCRRFPFPLWLAGSLNERPIHMRGDNNRREITLGKRLSNLVHMGVEVSNLRDISAQGTDDKVYNGFTKLVFSSIDEARNRALTIAMSTWMPHSPSSAVLLLTPQHVEHAATVNEQQGNSGNSVDERYIVYQTYFKNQHGGRLQRGQIEPDFTDMKTYLEREPVEEPPAEQPVEAVVEEVKEGEEEMQLTGRRRKMEIPEITVREEMIRREGYAQRLALKRAEAEIKMRRQREILQRKEKAREQVVAHRIRMSHVVEKEAMARAVRNGGGPVEVDPSAIANVDRQHAEKRKQENVFKAKQSHLQQQELKELDKKIERRDLRRRTEHEKLVLDKSLAKRKEDAQKRRTAVHGARMRDRARHSRLANARKGTLNFISQQNMIRRQLDKGVVDRHKSHVRHVTRRRVERRKQDTYQNRQEVREVLFENFDRKRQNASNQKAELKTKINLRRLEEQNRIAVLRAHREHMVAVKDLANSSVHGVLRTPSPGGMRGGYRRPQSASMPKPSPKPYIRNGSMSSRLSGGGPNYDYDHYDEEYDFQDDRELGDEQLSMQMSVLSSMADRMKSQYEVMSGRRSAEGQTTIMPPI